MRGVNARVAEGEATLGGLMDALRDRTYSLFVLLLTLPFCTPVPMFGISTPFGAVIAYLGVRLALGMEPRLPDRIRARPISRRTLGSVLRGAERLLRWLERFMRPRLQVLTATWLARAVVGAMIAGSAVLLMLPLPVPASNFFPAVTIVCLAAGLTQDDGAAIVVGFILFALTLGFFAAIAFFGTEAFVWVGHWWRS